MSKFKSISEIQNVDKPISDDDLDEAKQAYYDEFHRYGDGRHGSNHGLQWILGKDTFDWHFILAPYVDETLLEKDDPLGYCFHVMRTAFYRLWDEDGMPKKGRAPQDFGLPGRFHLGNFNQVGMEKMKQEDVEKNQMVTLGRINNEILSDKYKFTFQDFLFGEENKFIEYPVENFAKEFNFKTTIEATLKEQRKKTLVPMLPYAQQYLTDGTITDGKIIDFLKDRSKFAREYIEQKVTTNEKALQEFLCQFQDPATCSESEQGNCSLFLEACLRFSDGKPEVGDYQRIDKGAKELKNRPQEFIEIVNNLRKYRFAKWIFHPIFSPSPHYEDNFFVRVPLFHQKIFMGWDLVFFTGSIVNSPASIDRAGKRLDREIRNFMALRVSRRMERLFPPPHETIVEIRKDEKRNFREEDINEIRKKSARHLLYQMFRIALSLRTPYLHSSPHKRGFLFSSSPAPPSKDNWAKQVPYSVILNGQTVYFSFLANHDIPYLTESADKYCNEASKIEDFCSGLIGDFSTQVLSEAKRREYLRQWEEALKSKTAHDTIIGISPQILRVHKSIEEAVGAKNTTVLIRGDSGTGKELVAKAIHRDGPFVDIHCGAIESLTESMLFGVVEGAGTGVLPRPGKFVEANNGTLFFDEIGEMPLDLQKKLLRVLQERKVKPVGGKEDDAISVNVRVISATNRDLEKAVVTGEFRHDLFPRIKTLEIKAPRLRDRKDDIPVLAKHFLVRYCEEHNKDYTDFDEDARVALMHYRWPLNVRQLATTIEQAVITGSEPPLIKEQDLKLPKTNTSQELRSDWEENLCKFTGEPSWNVLKNIIGKVIQAKPLTDILSTSDEVDTQESQIDWKQVVCEVIGGNAVWEAISQHYQKDLLDYLPKWRQKWHEKKDKMIPADAAEAIGKGRNASSTIGKFLVGIDGYLPKDKTYKDNPYTFNWPFVLENIIAVRSADH